MSTDGFRAAETGDAEFASEERTLPIPAIELATGIIGMVTDTAVRNGSETIFKNLAFHAGDILRRVDLPRSISFKELAAHPHERLRELLRGMGGEPLDMHEAEIRWAFIQMAMRQEDAGLAFPDLTRTSFSWEVTSALTFQRPVVLVEDRKSAGQSHGLTLLSEIRESAERRGWHTISPSAPHHVPGTESVEPADLVMRLRELSINVPQQVGLLINNYDGFSSLPGAVESIRTARQLGFRIFLVSSMPKKEKLSELTLLPWIAIRVYDSGMVQEARPETVSCFVHRDQVPPAPERRKWNPFARRRLALASV